MAEFTLSELSVVDAYKLVTRIIAPRPIALVSSLAADGAGNLAPFSYFTMGGSNPASCVICPVNNRHGEAKDTVRNITATGEYTISVCTRAMADRMNQTSFEYGAQVDEFDKSGLTRKASKLVAPPAVAESPIHLECRLFQIVAHGDGALASNWIIGEILRVEVADDVLTDGLPDNSRIELIGRLGADYYTTVSPASLFELARPTNK